MRHASARRPNAWIGRPLRRREDEALVRGEGRFVDDHAPSGCLHLEFVRSPVAAGTLVGLEGEVSAMPGVVAVLTGADVADLPGLAVNRLVRQVSVPAVPYLAVRDILAVGQPVAAVVATGPAEARDAAAAMVAEIEGGEGVAPDTLFEERWESGDVAAAFASATHVVSVRVEHARLAPAPLEPRAAFAEFDPVAGLLTARLSTQTPHRARAELARILGLDERSVRVIAPDVGGAFGGKASLAPEEVVVAAAALRLGRPVKWCATRGDDLLAATQGRGGACEGVLALDPEGRFLALKADLTFPLGYWLPYSAVVPARNAGRVVPGPYRVPAVDVVSRGVRSATAAVNIYRGAGRPEAAMLMERLVEDAGRRTGLDPLALRRLNLVEEFPHRTPTGETLESGNYEALLDRAGEFAPAQRARSADGRARGTGLALYVEPCGQGWESARVGLDAQGGILAATGSSAQGQGRSTAFAQIVADRIGTESERVTVVHGDTASTPPGIGALASRSTAIGGSALLDATDAFLAKSRTRAATMLGVAPEGLEQDADGFATGNAPALRVDWATLADPGAEPLEATVVYEAPGEAWSSGCVVASVAIDVETGEIEVERLGWIDDAGIIVNPMLVEGQLRGGLAQGLGEALMERLVYDEDGQLVTASFMDYAMPRADDIPPVELDGIETPSTANRIGAKGVGEAGCIGVPAAIVNAALAALAPLGVTHLDMPLTSARIWAALQAAGTSRAGRAES